MPPCDDHRESCREPFPFDVHEHRNSISKARHRSGQRPRPCREVIRHMIARTPGWSSVPKGSDEQVQRSVGVCSQRPFPEAITTRITAVAASDAPLKKRPIRDSGACVGYVTSFRLASVAQAATTMAVNSASHEQASGG